MMLNDASRTRWDRDRQRAPQKSFRLSQEALGQLDFIMKATGMTKTQAVIMAIGTLHSQLRSRSMARR
jgi:predicted DNA-binding protein